MKSAIVNTIEEQIPKTIPNATNDWMTADILHILDETKNI